MNKKIFFGMVVSSFIGAMIALGGYQLMLEEHTQSLVSPVANNSPVNFTNYVFDSTDFVVPTGLNFVYAAKSATPAVVHIKTKYNATRANGNNPMDQFFKEYFGERYDQQRAPGMGAGSGVIVTADGYIATNNHVVEDADEIVVLLNDNRSYPATVIGTDPDTDLALLKVDADNLPFTAFGDSEKIQIGEWVLAIGNPFEFRSTVTAGIVSAKARNINILSRGRSSTQIEAFIQTDAAVNPGNSGGALVNLKGELVGINTAIASPTGAFAGYSFAVPATLVKKVIFDLKDFGAVQRPLLGIRISDVNAELAEAKNLNVLKGVYVASVGEASSAFDAGLEAEDVIIAIDGKKVTNTAQLQEQVALNRPGDKIEVTYIRAGKTKTTIATLKNSLNTTAVVKAAEAEAFNVEGAVLAPVGAELKAELGIKEGLQIKSVKSGKWQEAGIKEGFVVTKVDRQPIGSMKDMTIALNNARGEGILIEGIYPNGEKAYYGIGW